MKSENVFKEELLHFSDTEIKTVKPSGCGKLCNSLLEDQKS